MSKKDVDRHFPRNGPCLFHPTRYARHRLLDAIKSRHGGGESIASLMQDYDLTRAAVRVALSSTPDDNRMTRKEIRESQT